MENKEVICVDLRLSPCLKWVFPHPASTTGSQKYRAVEESAATWLSKLTWESSRLRSRRWRRFMGWSGLPWRTNSRSRPRTKGGSDYFAHTDWAGIAQDDFACSATNMVAKARAASIQWVRLQTGAVWHWKN